MPRSAAARARRTIVALVVLLLVAGGGLAAAVAFSTASAVPRLGLDLAGGTEIVLKPVLTASSDQEVTEETIAQSIAIIRQRVDSSGVSEAQISSSAGDNITVNLPGDPAQQREAARLVTQSAQLRFRPVLVVAPAQVPAAPTSGETPSPSAEPAPGDAPTPDGAPAPDEATPAPGDAPAPDEAVPAPSDAPAPAPSESTSNSVLPSALLAAPAPDPAAPAPEDAAPPADPDVPAADPAAPPADPSAADPNAPPADPSAADPGAVPPDPAAGTPSDLAPIAADPAIVQAFTDLTCDDPVAVGTSLDDDPTKPIVTCDTAGQAKYILGPVELAGTDLTDATSGLGATSTGASTNEWVVNLSLNREGGAAFLDITDRLAGLQEPRNQFAIVLDGSVVSAPRITTPISGGNAEISGTFTQTSAKTLADQLKFGALPLSFETQTTSQISAALGSEQLQRGVLAGLIGLALVAVYSLVQYRALGLVTIGSLVIAGLMTYLAIDLINWANGYRLSLAGVAGLIVAIGITADSFIVLFERVRDEVREGRPLVPAVETGWRRARRTIIISDLINFLAAGVLYILSVGSVKGFAFTLGLTTLIDLLVVVMFTHPALVLLAKMPFFADGHKLSGFDAEHLGRSVSRYAGRGRVRTPQEMAGATPGAVPAGRGGRGGRRGSVKVEEPRLTIAERKAFAAAGLADPPGLAPDQPDQGGALATATDEIEEGR